MKHSGPGIGGLVFALLGVALGLAGMVLVAQVQSGALLETSTVRDLGGGLLVFAMCSEFLGLGLAVGGLFQQERRRLWAIVGTSVSGTVVAGLVLLLAVFIAIGPPR